jgi:3',5'-cyclic AMP phosphodiesterase CpdA
VVPGNHDALVPDARLVPSALSGFLASDDACSPASPVFPSLRVRGRVALIGVSTAQPTNALSAAGSIGPDQLERLADRLAACGRAGWFRVLLIHHPPLPDGVAPRKRLRDAAGLHDVIARHGAELILHGHTHRRSSGDLPGPSGPVPVFGISSATAVRGDPLHRAAFAVFRIAPSDGGWSAVRQEHVYDPAGGRFVPEPEVRLS